MTVKTKLVWATTVGAALLALGACGSAPNGDGPPSADVQAPAKLPISINAAMVSVVDHSADYIFAMGNGDLPKTDHDWDQVRSAAYETVLAGKLIQMEGTGPYDAGWVTDLDWVRMADKLTDIGNDAVALAEAKSSDTAKWRGLADRLVENCNECHQVFKPDIPSEGILHESTERESKGQTIFN